MQLILDTETIYINSKMSNIDVPQPLDDKIIANSLSENNKSGDITSNGFKEKLKENVAFDDAKSEDESAAATVKEFLEVNGNSDINGGDTIENINLDAAKDKNDSTEDKNNTLVSEIKDSSKDSSENINKQIDESFREYDKEKDKCIGLQESVTGKSENKLLFESEIPQDPEATTTRKIGKDILVQKINEVSESKKITEIDSEEQNQVLKTLEVQSSDKDLAKAMEQSLISKTNMSDDNLDKIEQLISENVHEVEKNYTTSDNDPTTENSNENNVNLQVVRTIESKNISLSDNSLKETEVSNEKIVLQEKYTNPKTCDAILNPDIGSVNIFDNKPIEQEATEPMDIVDCLTDISVIAGNKDQETESKSGIQKDKKEDLVSKTEDSSEDSSENINKGIDESFKDFDIEKDKCIGLQESITGKSENKLANKCEILQDSKPTIPRESEKCVLVQTINEVSESKKTTEIENEQNKVLATLEVQHSNKDKAKAIELSSISEKKNMSDENFGKIEQLISEYVHEVDKNDTTIHNVATKESSNESNVNLQEVKTTESENISISDNSSKETEINEKVVPQEKDINSKIYEAILNPDMDSVIDNNPIQQEATVEMEVFDCSSEISVIAGSKDQEIEPMSGIQEDKKKDISEDVQKLTAPTDIIDNLEDIIENEKQAMKIITVSDPIKRIIENDELTLKCTNNDQITEDVEMDKTVETTAINKQKLIGGLIVKSPNEINNSSFCTERKDVKDPESTINEEVLKMDNDLDILKNNESNDKRGTTSEKAVASEDTSINKHIEPKANDDSQTEIKLKQPNLSKEQNEGTLTGVKNQEKVADDDPTLNDSDDECQAFNSKNKSKSPSKTEEILDTIIACMEVDRGDKNKVGEKTEIDNTWDKTNEIQKPEARPKISCNFSDTLDILSDDDDEPQNKHTDVSDSAQSKCINVDDDDDVMLVDEDPICDAEVNETKTIEQSEEEEKCVTEDVIEVPKNEGIEVENKGVNQKESSEKGIPGSSTTVVTETPDVNEKPTEKPECVKQVEDKPKPLVPDFLKTFKSNVGDMTRDELEELCLQLIVEGVLDRSNLSEIKTKLKTMISSNDEWRKKTMMLTKQNRDLQIVLKTVQEEQKKKGDGPIAPLKITRSVGMQVYMSENERGIKRKNPTQTPPNNRNTRNAPNPNPRQQQKSNVQIPVPRLVPATSNPPAKNTKPQTPQVQNTTVTSNSGIKTSSPMPLPSGVRNAPPVKTVEKRPFSSVQSVTVDLTDDEPPPKQQVTRNISQPPVRLVSQNQLLAPRSQVNQNNGPRKVYIPINSQNPAIRPGQTIMLKSVPPGQGPRPRNARPMVTIPSNGQVRMPRHSGNQRHPAPLPDVAKQQQPPNWKALPPSPDLKISKVENGIVISWKIEGYQEDSYEEIASYQLYAYQETASPPSTLLWKKIGDVKALPLPMACTLTQFMAGYKYYFAVRAVDVRSRIGPFSLPGSILLLNK